ncbi:MAG: hypothetical protein OJF49_000464 [Ktedonobacterales bacterium]|jgi:uncharacterized repeat protein (TIGR03847 family)|nr:MAG: hypothetical protein OJF49_000464 [Ktedonobacterales bacterium]
MAGEPHDFGRADVLDVEAIGLSGHRRFRIFARKGDRTAALWVEREHLEQLSLAIDNLLAQTSGGGILRYEAVAEAITPPGPPPGFPEHPDIEFQVASLHFGYDEDRKLVLLRGAPIVLIEEDDGEMLVQEDPDPLFSAFITLPQLGQLSKHLFAILSGGRPRCPFCGKPIADKPQQHLCEKQNGYHPVVVN